MTMNRRWFTSKFLTAGLMTTGFVLASCAATRNSEAETLVGSSIAINHDVTVFRSPTCGCCGLWVEHMKAAGFQVKDEIIDDMSAIKQEYGVPAHLSSCHTAIVDGYVVEGHVPASDVMRLLAEKPNAIGVAAPGMPIGSPGMESGDYVEPYTVFSFTEDGTPTAFAEHS